MPTARVESWNALADGMLTQTKQDRGICVNFRGSRRPVLTVDRRQIQEVDASWIEPILRESIQLLQAGRLPTYEWLAELSKDYPSEFQRLFERLLIDERMVSFALASGRLPFADLGLWPPDVEVIHYATELTTKDRTMPHYREMRSHYRERLREAIEGLAPPDLVAQRLRTLRAAGLFHVTISADVIPAASEPRGLISPSEFCPANYVALTQNRSMLPFLARGERVPVRHLIAVARNLRTTIGDARSRLAGAMGGGLVLPPLDSSDLAAYRPTNDDVALLTFPFWMPTAAEDEIRIVHILNKAAERQATMGDIYDALSRFSALGLALPQLTPEAHRFRLGDEERVLLSLGLDGEGPFASRVSAVNVMRIAVQRRLTLGAAYGQFEHFRALGFSIPQPPGEPVASYSPSSEDLKFVSRDVDGVGPWVDHDAIPVAQLVRSAITLGTTLGAAYESVMRFAVPGLRIPRLPSDTTAAYRPTEEDLEVFRSNASGGPQWIKDRPTPADLIAVAKRLKTGVSEVRNRLSRFASLGLELPPVTDDREESPHGS